MYVDIRQAATRLNISETQIRRLIKARRLKAINIGLGAKRKQFRLHVNEVERVKQISGENIE